MSDDPKANVIVMQEVYSITTDALKQNGLLDNFGFGGNHFTDALPDALVGTRQAPLNTAGVEMLSYRVRVANPPLRLLPPGDEALTNAAFDYRFAAKPFGQNGLEMFWTYQVKTNSVAPEDVAAVMRDTRRLRGKIWHMWDLSRKN